MNGKELAQIGYEGYGNNRDWKTYDDRPMPKWEELPESIQDAWVAAFRAVSEHFKASLDVRDTEKALHAISYVRDHSKAAVSGHSDYLFLVKALQYLGF